MNFLYERERLPSTEWQPAPGMIWMAGEHLFYENPRNRFMRFRRSFDLPFEPVSLEMVVWADTHYRLSVNGELKGRGPGRSDPTWTLYDTYRDAGLLRRGRNTIALLVLFQGFGTGARISIMQALLFRLLVKGANGEELLISGDRDWKASPAPEFVRPTPRLHGTLGCVEVQDMRLAETEWTTADYDDSGWNGCDFIKENLNISPWYHFAENPVPRRVFSRCEALQSVGMARAEAQPPEIFALGERRPFPVSPDAGTLPARIAPPGDGQTVVVNLSFPRIEAGYFHLEVEGAEGGVIDALYGESLIQAVIPKPQAAKILTSRWILREGRQTLSAVFNWLAFRHAQLWIWTDKPLTVTRAWVETARYPLPPVEGFVCSDESLTRLDAICDHSIRLCFQDAIVDSPSREQQQWMGDARKTAVFNHHRWGDRHLHRQLIEQIGQGMDWSGSMVPRYPSGNRNVTPIPSYDLDWICAFQDYFWFTGEDDLLQKWWPNLLLAMRWFTAFENADGLLEQVPHWKYIDVGDGKRRMGTGRILTTLNIQYLAACRLMRLYANRLGDRASEEWFQDKQTQLETAIRERLWAGDGYADACSDGRFAPERSEVTSAHALLHLESTDSPRAESLLRVLLGNAATPSSPFSVHIVLEALKKHGRVNAAVNYLRARYRGHLQAGATATWESWHIHRFDAGGYPVTASECHAWGAAPLAFFMNTILGLEPLEAAWRRIKIQPHVADLRHARGACLTPLGEVAISWKRIADIFQLEVRCPHAASGEVLLPDGSSHPLKSGKFLCPLNSVVTR